MSLSARSISPARPRGKLVRLEAVRGFAAAYVFVGHCLFERVFDKASFGPASYLFRASQEVIMAFFLISGFVIFYSVVTKPDMSFAGYARARILRIIPIYALALVVSLLIPGSDGPPAVGDRFQWLGAFTFMADENSLKPGVWFSPFCGNGPLWTLTYEWWFYFLFWPIYRYVPDAAQKYVVFGLTVFGIVSYTVVPNQISLILSYFIIWWTGVELAKAYLAGKLASVRALAAPYALLGGTILARLAMLKFESKSDIRLGFGYHPLLELRHLLAATAIALLAVVWHRAGWRFFDRLFGPFTLLAPMSYALYILHYPIIVNAHFLDGFGPLLLHYVEYIGLALGLAYAAEIWYQPRAVRAVKRYWPEPRRSPAASQPISP